ncbi:peroxisomal biogenesis factor 19 isoform X2 [Hirundo rustica]|uniref:peroxisomal biogenesis factor 19 isoform X2 n=1 Tax=Hirundo rustica TaxID=43150 RepID=UPI001A94A6AF|nr:peroxisomal biogenesis factor 19 isoform X2 [Hirundo rustica]
MRSIMESLLSKDVLYPLPQGDHREVPGVAAAARGVAVPGAAGALPGAAGADAPDLRRAGAGAAGGARGAAPRALRDPAGPDALQDLGHPPKELAGDTPPGFNLDLPGGVSGEQCRLM